MIIPLTFPVLLSFVTTRVVVVTVTSVTPPLEAGLPLNGADEEGEGEDVDEEDDDVNSLEEVAVLMVVGVVEVSFRFCAVV